MSKSVTLSGGSEDGMVLQTSLSTNEIRVVNEYKPGWFEVRSYRPVGDGSVWTMREKVDPHDD
jgi:hypothetical protein